jgi:hypothetical protein
MSTTDLTKATRELFLRTVEDQVLYSLPVVEELQRRNQVTYSGGLYVERLVDTDTLTSLVQEYTANEALTDEKKTTLEKPRFTMKYFQMPLRYDVDEYLQNVTAGKEEQLLDLAAHLVKKGQRDIKTYLGQKIFNSGSTTGVADGAEGMQSLVSALDSDVTYGTLSRSLSGGTNDWWQGADPGGLNEVITSSTQGTATNLTISNLRKWITESSVSHNMERQSDLYICMCPTLYNKLRAEMEAKMQYQPATGDIANQGFDKMILDGHQIVSVPYLQTTSTMKTWLFILNMNHWELRFHTKRNFDMTGFKWQGENANGYDYWLARIMVCGNLVCWKPNSSMWLSNVS